MSSAFSSTRSNRGVNGSDFAFQHERPSFGHRSYSVKATFSVAVASTAIAMVGSFAPAWAATTAKSGGTCPSRSVGTVTTDAKGQPLVCTKISKTKYQWVLPALGSFLRPIPLGQTGAAGPKAHRFNVRVTRVNFDASAEIGSEFVEASPPPAGITFVRVVVEASFLGPSASGSTDHYWYARSSDGGTYAASEGCNGYGSEFDVTAAVPIGGVVAGPHCFEVPTAVVGSLRLRVEGSDRPDTFFALR